MKRLRKSIIAPNMSVKLKNTFCEESNSIFEQFLRQTKIH